MDDPRVCVIGAGQLSSRRIYPYLGAAGAVLAGVCDLDADRAQRNARRFGGRPYTDWEAMLDRERPDGVLVCIGPSEHAALAPRILRCGIPVYTEKPPAPTADGALQVARVSRETGLLCMSAFKKRYATAYNRARAWIAGFPSDEVCSISVDYASGHMSNDSERTSFLLDFALHMIDLVPYLMGDVRQVWAYHKDRHAYAVGLQFESGAVGVMSLNDARSFAVPTEEVEISIRGGNAMTIHNSACWRIMEGEKAREWREPPTFISAGDSGHDTGHLAEIEAFVTALRDGGSTGSEIAASYRSMVLYEAIRDAAETGRPVDITYEVI